MLTVQEKILAISIKEREKQIIEDCRSIVKPNPTTINKPILNALIVGWGLVKPTLNDEIYYIDNWDRIQKAIEIDWLDEIPYQSDWNDCDNFADNFRSNMNQKYGWNTIGRLSVALYKPDTNKIIGYHRAVLIVAKEGRNWVLYAYDPMAGMNDGKDKIDGSLIRLKDWIYEPTLIEFN